MNPNTVAIIGIIVMLAFMFLLKMPVGFAMGLAGFLGMMYFISPQAAYHMVSTDIWGQFGSYGLSVIPLFIFMGEITFHTGLSAALYDAAYKWVGRLPGGIAITTVLASTGFAAVCGSNSATAATMGAIALPEMKKYNYDKGLSAGCVASGGTLGILIPPSVALIVIGLQTEQFIGDLFMGSIFPGLLLAVLFVITVFVICKRDPSKGPAGPKFPFKEMMASLPGTAAILILFLFVIGGLYVGWFTPTEAGGAGAFGAIIVSLAFRKMTWKGFKGAVLETVLVSCMVMMLVTGGVMFGHFLTVTRLPFFLAEWAGALPIPDVAILSVILIIYLIGGCIMDALGFLVVTIPIFYPLILALGYDPIWYGVAICLVTSMGAITPPVGVCAYVVAGIDKDITIGTIFRGVTFFLVAYIVSVILVVAFPDIILFLPGLR
jgi:tripartite ATP-independent transporter DctM subunit